MKSRRGRESSIAWKNKGKNRKGIKTNRKRKLEIERKGKKVGWSEKWKYIHRVMSPRM